MMTGTGTVAAARSPQVRDFDAEIAPATTSSVSLTRPSPTQRLVSPSAERAAITVPMPSTTSLMPTVRISSAREPLGDASV
jgi:hypothetical protein